MESIKKNTSINTVPVIENRLKVLEEDAELSNFVVTEKCNTRQKIVGEVLAKRRGRA
jgi:hypothetical protein